MAVSVHGRLESRLPAIGRALSPEMDIAIAEAADVIAEIAKELCPFDPHHVKGEHLRDAIHVQREREGDRILTWVVAWSKEAWYGFLVEYGSKHHTIHAGEWIVVPHPFLTPAAEAGRGIAKDRANRAIKAAAEAQ